MLRVALGHLEVDKVRCDHWVKHLLREAPHAEQFRKILTARGCPDLPAKEDEERALKQAGGNKDREAENLDALFEPAVAWMRENARGNSLVFEEVISYGFLRNFLALKRFALWSNGLALAVQLAAIAGVYYGQHKWAMQPEMAAVILAANLLYLEGVRRFVSEKSVKVQGFIYARQLFDSFYGAGAAAGDGKKAES
jgi:hypothetical protein